MLTKYEIGTAVDAGCGDWEFSRLIDWTPVSYVGIDDWPVSDIADFCEKALAPSGVNRYAPSDGQSRVVNCDAPLGQLFFDVSI